MSTLHLLLDRTEQEVLQLMQSLRSLKMTLQMDSHLLHAHTQLQLDPMLPTQVPFLVLSSKRSGKETAREFLPIQIPDQKGIYYVTKFKNH